MSEPATSWDADLYATKHSFVWKAAGDLVDLLDPRPGESVLDVGCGTGQLTAAIANREAAVVGVDRSPEMIARAAREVPHVRFIVGDARLLGFDAAFDAVFSNATLHWVRPPELAVRSIAQALRPGGRFVAEFGGRGNVGRVVAAAGEARAALGKPLAEPHPWFFPGVAEYASLLEAHGLEVTFAHLFDRPTPTEPGPDGARNWLRMFGRSFLEALSDAEQARLFEHVESLLRPTQWRDDRWVIDYRRLRVVAVRSR